MTFREISVTSKMSISDTVHLVDFDLNEPCISQRGQPNPRLETDAQGAAQPWRAGHLQVHTNSRITHRDEADPLSRHSSSRFSGLSRVGASTSRIRVVHGASRAWTS